MLLTGIKILICQVWRGAVVSFPLPRLHDPAPSAELPAPPFVTFSQAGSAGGIFNPFPLTSFLRTVFATSLTWHLLSLFTPLTGWNPAILFHQLHKIFPPCPSSQLAVISSSFWTQALLYLLRHLTHSTSCCGCLILEKIVNLLKASTIFWKSPD